MVTGILLALIYVPSAGEAWNSLQTLNHQVALGWFIRALHGWGSNFMLAIVLIHMVQVFLFGAYKFPRELTWMLGVFLLLFTLGMAFTGQVLAVRSGRLLGIGHRSLDCKPRSGVWFGAGSALAGRTDHCRRNSFALLRVARLCYSGTADRVCRFACSDGPETGNQRMADAGQNRSALNLSAGVSRADRKRRHAICPRSGVEGCSFSGFILLAIAACAILLGPFGPSGQPDPTIIQTAPRPDPFFLWIYALLSFLPPAAETPILLIGPVVAIIILLALPFVAGEGEKSWKRRPIAVLAVLVIAVALGTLTNLGVHTPWSPVMDAWSSEPIPMAYLKGRTPLEYQGALVFQAKQCHNCHSLGGDGGKRGPALDRVALRLTPNQLVRQVIQGGGNMPAYGKNLSPAETTALVKFLETLYPPGNTPARDASRSVVGESGSP